MSHYKWLTNYLRFWIFFDWTSVINSSCSNSTFSRTIGLLDSSPAQITVLIAAPLFTFWLLTPLAIVIVRLKKDENEHMDDTRRLSHLYVLFENWPNLRKLRDVIGNHHILMSKNQNLKNESRNEFWPNDLRVSTVWKGTVVLWVN